MPLKVYGFSLHSEIIDRIDKIRGNIPRSRAIDSLLMYVCSNEDTIKAIIPKGVSYEDYYKNYGPKEQVKQNTS